MVLEIINLGFSLCKWFDAHKMEGFERTTLGQGGGGKQLLHQALLMASEGFEILGRGGDPLVETRQAIRNFLLFGERRNHDFNFY